MAKKKKSKIQQIVIILLALLLAFLLIYSRGMRHARRATVRVEHQQNSEKKHDTVLLSDTTNFKNNKAMISKEILLGKVNPSESVELMPVPLKYASREGIYMHKEAYDSFKKMHKAAEKEGISLLILSGFRSFNHQKRIWENKWHGNQVLHGGIVATDIEDPNKRALEIMRFSAMPGTSRHHWGTDIDLNSLNNSYFEDGYGKKVYKWLLANAGNFGFCQPYTKVGNNRETGYEEEKWHWSYIPVAGKYYQAYKESVNYKNIKGFSGWETAKKLNVIEQYVLSINNSCIN